MISKIHFLPILNFVLAELRLGLKNHQVGKTKILNDYLCKGLNNRR
ncbi:hypothetical protein THERMOS_2078 [Bathymodiolus thermophilus thioautotrophic gill symbiont]|uniref:Uncharacterized protein n=1 Tax=Bathymodiolus thermophilus thioautotrophic gill symbiont TaxID=2360 RepID=A0A8H8XEG5_9GAMM|nr:hypothetical protein THERMOS_2078 [Bathymodiolus thermophilus thioautotrophic gill symbiont]